MKYLFDQVDKSSDSEKPEFSCSSGEDGDSEDEDEIVESDECEVNGRLDNVLNGGGIEGHGAEQCDTDNKEFGKGEKSEARHVVEKEEKDIYKKEPTMDESFSTS